MTGTSTDHVVSLIIFLTAILLFIGLFNQTIQTGITYQKQSYTNKKTSDLLDTMLLTPGIQTKGSPVEFGVQDPEFTQYQMNPFALMRLQSSQGTPVSYAKTPGITYSSITFGNNYLLTPSTDSINYSTALELLGIRGSYGFQLAFTPTLKVQVTETATNPLSFGISVVGTGFPVSNAAVSYCLVTVLMNGASTPDFENVVSGQTGTVITDASGLASVQFPVSTSASLTYAFVVYAHLDGVTGVGYIQQAPTGTKSVIPFDSNLSAQQVLIAHSDDVPNNSGSNDLIYYNSTFIFVNENYDFHQTPPGNASDQFGVVRSGAGYPCGTISLSSYNPGILVVAYSNNGNQGIVMMPWGLSSLGFPLIFGGDPSNQSQVSSDIRQIQVNGVSYQAKLSLCNVQGYQVINQ